MAVVTSIINLKGGVGKTTLTLALAHYLAGEHGKRVLVIDLDPQTNATIALVTERRWRERDQAGQTLYQLFKDQTREHAALLGAGGDPDTRLQCRRRYSWARPAAVEHPPPPHSGPHHQDRRPRYLPWRPSLCTARGVA